MLIHHYTNIESLAMILSTRKIRFNRLDRMDDLEEGRVEAQGVPLGKYTYVSCWTEEEEESIPLWNMYAGKEMGVRISLPQDMFQDYSFLDGFCGLDVSEKCQSMDSNPISLIWKIPGSEYKNKNYLIIPIESNKPTTFYQRIQYVDDVLSLTKQLATRVDEEVECFYNLDWCNVGTLKHRRWEFQKESRFLIRIIPTNGEISLFKPQEWLAKLKDAFDTKMEPHFETYDLSLKEEVFKQLEVTLSPSITMGQRIIVESLLNQYAPNAIIAESSLKQYVQMK